jgi:hypothetical protein
VAIKNHILKTLPLILHIAAFIICKQSLNFLKTYVLIKTRTILEVKCILTIKSYTMKKHIFSLFFLILVVCGIMFASDGFDVNHKAANSPVHQYTKEHIMPVLLQKRQLLEKELSAAEKNEIAECRASLKQLHMQEREFMQQKPAGISMHDYMEQNGKNHGYEMHKQTKAIMARLQTIADNHTATLGNIKTDLEPSVKQWKDDITHIIAQRKEESSANQSSNGPGHDGFHGMRGDMFHGLNGEHAQVRFLLLAANASENENEAALNTPSETVPVVAASSNASVALSNTGITSFQITPNPASSELVTGNAPLPANNQLFIYDMQGNAVVSLQNVQPAQHLDVNGLANGTYVVQLKNGNQEQNQKIVISH